MLTFIIHISMYVHWSVINNIPIQWMLTEAHPQAQWSQIRIWGTLRDEQGALWITNVFPEQRWKPADCEYKPDGQ